MKIRRLLSLGIIVLAAVLVLTLGSGIASAADFCRGDPILYLSNGKTFLIDVLVDGVRVDNVSWIDYRVSLPKNVTLGPKEIWGDKYGAPSNPEFIGPFPELAAKERIRFSGNSKWNEYQVDVKVTANKRIRDGVVIIYSEIGFGRPILVTDALGSHWEWPDGSIKQSAQTVEGKVGQTIQVRLFAD